MPGHPAPEGVATHSQGLAHLVVAHATFTALSCLEGSPTGEQHAGNHFDVN